MPRVTVIVASVAASAGLLIACSKVSTPLAPTPKGTTSGDTTNATTLKASAPTAQSPTNDQQVNGAPVLTAGSATPTFGGSVPFQYRFQVFDPSNALVQDSGLVNAPSFAVTANLQPQTRYTWHARAEYQGAFGPWSSTASFVSQQPFDMRQAVIWNNPPDLPLWAETSKITFIQFRPDALIVDFDKRTGPGHWPNMPFTPGGSTADGGVEYTLGACFNINKQWNCSAVIQFWEGRPQEAAAAPSTIPVTWYYDPARWGPMAGYMPADGETVGIFAAVGNVRGIKDSSLLLAKERTNVQLVPFDSGHGSTYTYGRASTTSLTSLLKH
jgi:hypothetical protein